MTNAERIRSLTDEELFNFLDKISNENRKDWSPIGCYNCAYYGTHHASKDCEDCEWKNGISGWLKNESRN